MLGLRRAGLKALGIHTVGKALIKRSGATFACLNDLSRKNTCCLDKSKSRSSSLKGRFYEYMHTKHLSLKKYACIKLQFCFLWSIILYMPLNKHPPSPSFPPVISGYVYRWTHQYLQCCKPLPVCSLQCVLISSPQDLSSNVEKSCHQNVYSSWPLQCWYSPVAFVPD